MAVQSMKAGIIPAVAYSMEVPQGQVHSTNNNQ